MSKTGNSPRSEFKSRGGNWPVIFGLLLLPGCAGTTVSTVTNPAYGVLEGTYADADADGIRYYESSPFLLVYTDGKGGLNSKLLFLPDLTKKRVIDPHATLASNNTTLTFVNGVLTQGKTVVDETVVPKAMIGALEKAATAALGGALNAAKPMPTAELPPPLLFKIVLKGNQARLVGGQSVDKDGKVRLIDVTISDPTKPEAKPASTGQAPAATDPKKPTNDADKPGEEASQ